MDDVELALVPAHTRTAMPHSEQGSFCSRGETMAPGGQCPDGCDHEAHYSNDGHPECVDDEFMREAKPRLSLHDLERRARNSTLTDPSWRQDYRS